MHKFYDFLLGLLGLPAKNEDVLLLLQDVATFVRQNPNLLLPDISKNLNLGYTLSEYMRSKIEENVIDISWPRNCPAKKMSVDEYFDAISQDMEQEEYVCADGRIEIVTHVKVWPEVDLFRLPLVFQAMQIRSVRP